MAPAGVSTRLTSRTNGTTTQHTHTLHYQYTTLQYTTKYTTLQYITKYTILRSTLRTTLRSTLHYITHHTTLYYEVHYSILRSTLYNTTKYTTHYTTKYITLHTTLHYTRRTYIVARVEKRITSSQFTSAGFEGLKFNRMISFGQVSVA